MAWACVGMFLLLSSLQAFGGMGMCGDVPFIVFIAGVWWHGHVWGCSFYCLLCRRLVAWACVGMFLLLSSLQAFGGMGMCGDVPFIVFVAGIWWHGHVWGCSFYCLRCRRLVAWACVGMFLLLSSLQAFGGMGMCGDVPFILSSLQAFGGMGMCGDVPFIVFVAGVWWHGHVWGCSFYFVFVAGIWWHGHVWRCSFGAILRTGEATATSRRAG